MDEYANSIATRYDKLSGQDCCLSCGGAFSLATIKQGDVCVDLGCGKGHDAMRMATLAGKKGFAYGVDISEGMMETARQEAKKLSLTNIAFIRSPLENIKLGDQVADVLISNCTINHSLCQDKVWKEIFRLLKEGGQFVVSDIYSLEPVLETFRGNPDMVAECWAGAVTKETYLNHIKQAGLRNIEIVEESLPYEKGRIRVASFTVKGCR